MPRPHSFKWARKMEESPKSSFFEVTPVQSPRTSNALSPSQLAIQENIVELTNYIDLTTLYAYLVQAGLLTRNLRQRLKLDTKTDLEKKNDLLSALIDRKEAVEQLIQCLRDSARDHPGTDHVRLADLLEEDYTRKKQECENVDELPAIFTEVEPRPTDQYEVQGGASGSEESIANFGVQDPLICRDEGPGVGQMQQEKPLNQCRKECCLITTRYSCCIVAIVFLICTLLASVLTTQLWWFKTHQHPSPVAYNQTVPLQFPSSIGNPKYIHSLSLKLQAHRETCSSMGYVVPCNNLKSGIRFAKNVSKGYFRSSDDQWYLLNGSVIYVNNTASGATSSAASIWLFDNAKTAQDSDEHKPQCSNHDSQYSQPLGSRCLSVSANNSVKFPIYKNSFYYLRCFVDGQTCYPTWTMDVYQYDHTRFMKNTNVSIVTTAKTNITLNQNFDFSLYGSEEKKQCILVFIPPVHDCDYASSMVLISDIAKVRSGWIMFTLFPVVGAFILVVVLCILVWYTTIKIAKRVAMDDAHAR